jgi:hypothetical protein
MTMPLVLASWMSAAAFGEGGRNARVDPWCAL